MRPHLLAILAICAATVPAHAQDIASTPPAPKSVPVVATVTSTATPTATPTTSGTTRQIVATYRASWNGIGALNVAYAATLTPSAYNATANLTPTGLTGITSHLKKSVTYSAQAHGHFANATTLTPVAYSHQGGKKKRKVSVDFARDDVKTSAMPDFGTYGDPPATKAQKLEATDSITAILSLAVANPGDVCSKTLKIFDGKARYDLVFTPQGKEMLKTKGDKGEALKCRVDYKRVAGYTKPEPGDKPLFDKPFTFWFTAPQNGLQAPARFSVESNWGPISMSLESLKITTSTP